MKRSVIISAIILLAIVISVTTATYAWFTFTTSAIVEPIGGTISGGGVELLISNSADGPFDRTCELILANDTEELQPLSTADLDSYYMPTGQTPEGIPTGFRDISDEVGNYVMTGSVYLLSEGSPCRVYLHAEELYFGEDIQAAAAMRLGLKIRTNAGTRTVIFRLDDMMDTSSAEAMWTIEDHGTVYGGEYVQDPAEDIDDYCAYGSDEDLSAGRISLGTLEADEVAEVEYILYLEGCDPNCINSVQARDVSLQFGFAGLAL